MDDFVADAIFIDASPERVLEALLEPEEVIEWLDGEEASIAAGVGGEYSVRRSAGRALQGRIAALEAPVRLLIEGWHRTSTDGVERGPTTVTFTLQPHDDGVWITVREDGLDVSAPDAAEVAHAVRADWIRATVTLKRLIEQI